MDSERTNQRTNEQRATLLRCAQPLLHILVILSRSFRMRKTAFCTVQCVDTKDLNHKITLSHCRIVVVVVVCTFLCFVECVDWLDW